MLNLIAVGLLTAIGFASVYIARSSLVDAGSLTYAGIFVALYLAAHLVARYTVPCADPVLLPLAALLSAIGVTVIYRLDPDDAFRQSLWVVIGVVLFALTLILLRRDYRVLESYKYLFGIAAILLLLLPRAPRHRADDQRRPPLGEGRLVPVPAGRAGEDLPDHLPRRLPARQARGARAGPAQGLRAAAR